jgi:hypothetical protein
VGKANCVIQWDRPLVMDARQFTHSKIRMGKGLRTSSNGTGLNGEKRGRILRSCLVGAGQYTSHCSADGSEFSTILTQLDATFISPLEEAF